MTEKHKKPLNQKCNKITDKDEARRIPLLNNSAEAVEKDIDRMLKTLCTAATLQTIQTTDAP